MLEAASQKLLSLGLTSKEGVANTEEALTRRQGAVRGAWYWPQSTVLFLVQSRPSRGCPLSLSPWDLS